jgi:hypothetical protein
VKIRISKISVKKGFTAREAVDREEVRQLAESMKSIGQREPILIRKHDKELINGNHRLAAAKLLHWKEIECEEVEASDVTCHRLSLVANRFSRPLTDIEIGRKADAILQSVKWNKGREKLKIQLVGDLGLHSVRKLEDCLTTYRNLAPEAQKLVSHGVQNVPLKAEQVRKIRQLPQATQVVLVEQLAKIKDDPGRVDRLISGHVATQQGARTDSQASTNATLPEEEKQEPERFFPVFKFERKGRIQAVSQDALELETGHINLAEVEEQLKLLQEKAEPRDFVTVGLLLESPMKKVQEIEQ